jgi:hypothetical protein
MGNYAHGHKTVTAWKESLHTTVGPSANRSVTVQLVRILHALVWVIDACLQLEAQPCTPLSLRTVGIIDPCRVAHGNSIDRDTTHRPSSSPAVTFAPQLLNDLLYLELSKAYLALVIYSLIDSAATEVMSTSVESMQAIPPFLVSPAQTLHTQSLE